MNKNGKRREGERETGGGEGTAGANRERVHALYDRGLERVQALPEVEAAALAGTEPMWSARSGSIRVPGMDSVPRPRGAGPYFTAVSPDYFHTIGARIVRGRAFTADDVAGSPQVAIVTESLARLVWQGEDPLGSCFHRARSRGRGLPRDRRDHGGHAVHDDRG